MSGCGLSPCHDPKPVRQTKGLRQLHTKYWRCHTSPKQNGGVVRKITVVSVFGAVGLVFAVTLGTYWPGTSSDAAGWVQAFGAIVAIGLAVFLQFDASSERQRQASQLANAFAGQLLLCLDNLQLASRNQQYGQFGTGRKLLADALAIDVGLGELDAGFVGMVLTLRGIGITLLTESDQPIINFPHFDAAFGNAAHDVRVCMVKTGLEAPPKSFSP